MPPQTSTHIKNILALIRRNDPAAMELIYDAFAPQLYGIAFKITRNEAKAEDLLLETLVYFHKNQKEFEEKGRNLFLHLVGILQMITKNKMGVFLDNQNRKSFIPVNSEDKNNSSRDGELLYSGRPNNPARIHDHLNILDLVFFGGIKMDDLANLLSSDEINVKKILHQELKKYRKESEQVI